jgi:hypothetical protein
MIHGFDLDSPLVCEGIVGDGCGGGRIFSIEEGTLKAYDPQSQDSTILLENIKEANSISKKACILFIKCKDEKIEFDLPTMRATIKKF